MKICFFGDAAALHLWRWSRYFVNKGYEVHVITFNPNILDGYEPVNVHVIRKQMPGSALIFRIMSLIPLMLDIKKIIRNINPDIIHSHSVVGYAWIAMLTGFHPFIVTPWGSDIFIDIQKSKIEKLFTTLALKKADLITCDGSSLRKALTKLGIKPKKIYHICWGTDTRTFNPKQGSKKIREDLGIFNSPMIISSKSLEPIYDIESLVKSISLVLKKVPKAKFVIAGRGSQEAELKQLAKSMGVSNSVKFIGFIPSDKVPKYLASADIYVCTSLSEGGLAISTKEAMASELPVVITDLEVNTEWIENGANGFVIPPKDPKSLAEKIIYLIEHEDVRMKFGELGRKLVKESFEYDKELKKVENIYAQLIREHKK